MNQCFCLFASEQIYYFIPGYRLTYVSVSWPVSQFCLSIILFNALTCFSRWHPCSLEDLQVVNSVLTFPSCTWLQICLMKMQSIHIFSFCTHAEIRAYAIGCNFSSVLLQIGIHWAPCLFRVEELFHLCNTFSIIIVN